MKKSFETELKDPETNETLKVEVRVCDSMGGLEVFIEGYGTNGCKAGHGAPFALDFHDGELRLLVWADINDEDPTHTIDLSEARETNRKSEREQGA